MNKTVIRGKLKQVRGRVQVWRGQRAGDPIGQAAGQFNKLVGVLQEKFGYNRERAIRELQRRMGKHPAGR